jgi:uncharacterized protein YjbI with pentapeptide repeats
MKKLLKITALTVLLAASPALAQNAGQIENATGGASCAGCNLFQAEFAFKDMPNRDFSKSRLRQSNLSLSTMNGTNFSGADLSVSNMFGGRFTGASFRDANLQNAVLVGAYFGGADFHGANLAGAQISGADMQTAKITQAQLNGVCGDEYTKLPAGMHVARCR